MANIPLPTTLNSVQNWRKEVDRAKNLTGSRSLESASITGGVLRVRHGGGVIIGDGGILDVRNGNLILGKGKIDGAALKEQLEAQNIDSGDKSSSFSNSTDWKTTFSLDVSPPEWADEGIAYMTLFQQLTCLKKLITEAGYGLEARLSIGSNASSLDPFTYMSRTSDGTEVYYVSNLSFMSKLSGSGPSAVTAQVRGNVSSLARYVQGRISGVVLWTRKTS